MTSFASHPNLELKKNTSYFVSDKKVSAIAEFVIKKRGLAITIVEDKHLKNIKAKFDLGKRNFLPKFLLWQMNGSEYIRHSRSTMAKSKWVETDFDLAEANGRQSVFMALARIYRFVYNPPLPLTERKAWKA
ncbi:874_t:CDS:2 [Funneliformis mosseae]|uniref:874_t:CDS:1 n=1 Tax=Funneliformis mosseae TaxID=27381 RepID=A0A9N9GSQ3_FUNMO|nr:874_t:CDS:2 [Funneliformis mosseae]